MPHSWCLVVFFGSFSILLSQPNILFILTDDQRPDAVGAFGKSVVKTPEIDELVANGVSFQNAYNMGAWHGAVCVASRSMFLHGQSLWKAESLDNRKAAAMLTKKEATWPQFLKKSGYRTYFAGKWHAAVSPHDVFDKVRNVRGGMPEAAPGSYSRTGRANQDLWDPSDPKLGGFWEGGTHWTEVVADDACQFLKTAAQDTKPFFAYVAFNAPHDPRQAPKTFVEYYREIGLEIPKSFLKEPPHFEAMGLRVKNGELLRDERLAVWPRTNESVLMQREEYYAQIEHLDHNLGRILKVLDETGLVNDTYIIFTSDHGLAIGDHGLMGKQNMFEHSLKAPLIIVGPNIRPGEKREQLVYLQDIVPTTLALAGAEIPENFDFRNLLPVIKNNEKSHEVIYGAYRTHQRMIRSGKFKLILYPRTKTKLLFNLAEDPEEIHDLSAESSFLHVQQELFEKLLQQQEVHGDRLDLRSSYPEFLTIEQNR